MPNPTRKQSFYDVIRAAIEDMAEHGFDSVERLEGWMLRIRSAAETSLVPANVLERTLRERMASVFEKTVEKGVLFKRHPGISRFTVDQLKPELRKELDRRIMANANLIRLNRKQAIDKTLQRFSGWATSIPKGGSGSDRTKGEAAKGVKKAMASLPFEERRVLIDQGAKLVSSIDEIVATDGGAIAGIWHSHWRRPGYNYREDHKERDQKIYCVRGNWAKERGLMTKCDGYTDDMTKPAEEPYCSCFYQYIYALRHLPDDMLTAKGRAELRRVRVA